MFYDRLLGTLCRTTLGGIVVCLLSSAALSDARRLSLMPDPRGEFIRLCAPFMVSRYAHPEAVCDCVRNTIFDQVDDSDVLDALLFGVTERGVLTLNRTWLPQDKWPQIEQTMTAIAEPTLECMFGDGHAKRVVEAIPPDGLPAMPPVQDLTP